MTQGTTPRIVPRANNELHAWHSDVVRVGKLGSDRPRTTSLDLENTIFHEKRVQNC